MKQKILIVGGGGHAKVLINVLKKCDEFEIAGYVDIHDKGRLLGIPYLGDDTCLNKLKHTINKVALGIGQVILIEKRVQIIKKLKAVGYDFPIIVSPDAIINENVTLHEGVQIFDGAIVNCNSIIRAFSILNTRTIIEHDCSIGNYCHIASGAVLSGGVIIGDSSMVGANAVIIQNVKIASGVLVGAGSVVIKDIKDNGTYVGNPVRKV